MIVIKVRSESRQPLRGRFASLDTSAAAKGQQLRGGTRRTWTAYPPPTWHPRPADRLDCDVGVLGQPGRVVVAGQVGREGVMAALPQLPLDQVPVPSDIPAAVNQHEGGHRHLPPRGSSSLTGQHQHAKRLTQPGQHRDEARAVQRGSQQRPPACASEHDQRRTRLAGTSGKRPVMPLVRDEEAYALDWVRLNLWPNRRTPCGPSTRRRGPRSPRWWSATTASLAAAGAWASMTMTPERTQSTTAPPRSAGCGKAGRMPPSCTTATTAWAGASSAPPTRCPGSRAARRTKKARRPRQTGGSRAATPVRGTGVRAWPLRRSPVRSISSRAWAGGPSRDTRRTPARCPPASSSTVLCRPMRSSGSSVTAK